jgi:putative RNA 2'-phosphotransferase
MIRVLGNAGRTCDRVSRREALRVGGLSLLGGLSLTLEPGGWVAVDTLLAACARQSFPISRADLDEVVARNNKQRFAFDDDGARIRANQGHSVEVDLQLEPAVPPAVLYHGTAAHLVETIRREGLQKMRRHHVHLSADVETARRVGARPSARACA